MEEKQKYGKDEGGLGTDPMSEVERVITSDLVARGKDMLAKLVETLDGDNAVRMLRIVENIAKHHRELIAAMNGGDTFRGKFGSSVNENVDALGGLGSVMNFNNQEENFGAQALKGLVDGRNEHEKSKVGGSGAEIKALVEALDLATSKNGDPKMNMIATKLDQKLSRMLDDDTALKVNVFGATNG